MRMMWACAASHGGAILVCLLLILSGCNGASGRVRNEIGSMHYRQGNYYAARDAFHRAVADDPHNADFVHNLAAAERKLGQTQQAEQNYRQALYVDPAHQPSYHGLAQLMNEQGRSSESRDLLQAWADTQPYTPEAHVELAWMQRESGDRAAAEQSLMQALRVSPNHHVASNQLGQIYQESGQPERAQAMYRRSLHARWYQPHVHSRMAELKRSQPGEYSQPQVAGTLPAYGPPPMSYQPASRQIVQYPLPTYSHLTAGSTTQVIAPSTSGQIAYPVGTQYASPVMAPYSVQPGQPVQLGSPTYEADPAHAHPQVSEAPEVRAY